MEYTVKALADLAGVTPRTLRWYDRTGLLKPLRTTEAGYRLYGPKQLDRLQDILFYRELAWIPKADLRKLPMWEGDKLFLDLLEQDAPFFSLKLRYQGDRLTEAVLNGRRIV